MIKRECSQQILKLSKSFPSLSITGPRQSGKTTLIRELFPHHSYFNFEDPETRSRVEADFKGFLKAYGDKAIFDEAQKVPNLFSHLQICIDEKRSQYGRFILSGSQNFLLSEKISQSLAGRIGICKLFPFSLSESRASQDKKDVWEYIWRGGYPEVVAVQHDPLIWYGSYIETYVERDVRSLLNVTNLGLFQRFLKLLAGRTGQILNSSNLGSDVGCNNKTIRNWCDILVASYLITEIPSFSRNMNKRVIKSPKVCFLDTGVVSYLLGIHSTQVLKQHPLRGAIFESFVVSEILKYLLNHGHNATLSHWRVSESLEVDLIIEYGGKIFPIEIKSGETFDSSMLKSLDQFQEQYKVSESALIYNGESFPRVKETNILNVNEIGLYLKQILG